MNKTEIIYFKIQLYYSNETKKISKYKCRKNRRNFFIDNQLKRKKDFHNSHYKHMLSNLKAQFRQETKTFIKRKANKCQIKLSLVPK